MPASRESYIVNGKYVSPIDAQEKGNIEVYGASYSIATPWRERFDSSTPNVPFILGGSSLPSIYPKAWIGADEIFNLREIVTSGFVSKMSANKAVIRGEAAVADNNINLCTADTQALYGYNRAGVTPFDNTVSYPKAGLSLFIDATGKDCYVENSATKASLAKDFERSIRFTPTTITPASRVYIFSKGHTDAVNCEFAISYDSTSIYRTIGGVDKVVGATATVLALGVETRFCIVFKGTLATKWDSFYINNVASHSQTTNSIGTTTSNLTELIGGIRASNTEGAVSIANALGYYRQYCMYNADRLLNPGIIANQQKASYANYNTSAIVFGIGDSIMNGFKNDTTGTTSRRESFFFVTEDYFNAKGIDVIFNNQGYSGSNFVAGCPQDTPFPAYYNKTLTYNVLSNNVRRWIREYGADIIVGNAGTNELSNRSIQELPIPGYSIMAGLQLISECCARYNVPFIHNSCGCYKDAVTPSLPQTVSPYVRNYVTSRSCNVFDWAAAFTNPDTDQVWPEMMADNIHPSTAGYRVIAHLLIPKLFGYFNNILSFAPNAIWDRGVNTH